MKFLADMGISPEAVRFLTKLGHDAIHLHDQGLDREDRRSVKVVSWSPMIWISVIW